LTSFRYTPAAAQSCKKSIEKASLRFLCINWGHIFLFLAVDFGRAFGRFSAPCEGFLMKTYLPKKNLDQRKWHVVDANGAILGRLAVQIANILRGKDKPIYTAHLDAGDFVVVINAEKVRLTGKKETDKEFMSYSGWKGGEKYASVALVRARHPEKLIMHAVRGMVPKNRLGRVLMTKLKVYKGSQHPHAAQQPAALTPAK
jgi:large subunit ribosomal protein L13